MRRESFEPDDILRRARSGAGRAGGDVNECRDHDGRRRGAPYLSDTSDPSGPGINWMETSGVQSHETCDIRAVAGGRAVGIRRAKPCAPSDPIVQAGLYGYDADGKHSAAAYQTPPELKSTVYLNRARCVIGAGNSPAPADATDVWQFSGNVVSDQPAGDRPARFAPDGGAGPSYGRESSLAATDAACRRNLRFDQAGVDGRPPCAPAVSPSRRVTRHALRHGADSGGAKGGGARSGGTAGAVSVVARPAGGSGVSGGASQPAAGVTYEVDLWLVRSLPGKPNDVNHSVLRVNESGGSFSFAPITVPMNSGSAAVFVGGLIRVVRNANGEDQLLFTTSRRVMTSGADCLPPEAGRIPSGSTRIIERMPGPERCCRSKCRQSR